MPMTRIPSVFFVGSLAMLALAGCNSNDPAKIIGQRAVERWDLLAGGHAVKAYDYLTPGYRSTHTLEQYVAFVATSRIHWRSAKFESIKCEEEICTAKLIVKSMVPGAVIGRGNDMDIELPVTEKWVRSDAQWFFLPDAKIDPVGVAKAAEAASESKLPPAATDAAHDLPVTPGMPSPTATPAPNPPIQPSFPPPHDPAGSPEKK